MSQVAYFADQIYMPSTVTSGLLLRVAALQNSSLPSIFPISTNCPHQSSTLNTIAKQRKLSFQSFFGNMTDKMVNSCTSINTNSTINSSNKVQTNEKSSRCNSGESLNEITSNSLPVIDILQHTRNHDNVKKENKPNFSSSQSHQTGFSTASLDASDGKCQ